MSVRTSARIDALPATADTDAALASAEGVPATA